MGPRFLNIGQWVVKYETLSAAKGCALNFLVHSLTAETCEILPIHILSNTINTNISTWNVMQGIKYKNTIGTRGWRAEESLQELKVGNLVPRGERLMSLLSRSHVLLCTCYNSFGHAATAGSGFAPMIRDDTTANVHTTIRSIATGVLQNSSQITKEEENDFFPPFYCSPFLHWFTPSPVEHNLQPAAWEHGK